MKIFTENLQNLIGRRFDPEFVAFTRRQALFMYPQATIGRLLVARPEYGAAESGAPRESMDEVRYVRITDIDENGELSSDLGATAENIENKYLLSHGDLLFARSGNTVGKCYCHDAQLVSYPCIYAGYLIRYRFNHDLVLPRFIFAVSQTSYFRDWVLAVRRAAGQPNINAQEFSSLAIPLPPLDVQRRIVAELDEAYAAKRAADQKAAELLRSIDDMVLEELGISRPLPQKGLLNERIFTLPIGNLLGERIDAIAYQFAKSEFYRCVNQSTYEISRLHSLVKVCRNQTDEITAQRYVGLENINPEDGEYIETETKESCSSAVIFHQGQILFPKLRPYLNKVWLANFDGVASAEFISLEVGCNVDKEYLLSYLRLRHVASTMGILMTGNTLPRVQIKDVLSLPIPVPPIPVQERIVRNARAMKEEVKKLKAEAAAKLESAKRRIEAELMG